MSATFYSCRYCRGNAPNVWEIIRPVFGEPQIIRTCNKAYDNQGDYVPISCMGRAVAAGYRKQRIISR